ncbi:hypothetical protein [Azospirillum sp.]|uniref:hypothetical protein n=1 Tax=Azospirillum sp. TaxID=34012 RepID=UPI003D7255B3
MFGNPFLRMLTIAAVLTLPLAACDDQTSAEKAGAEAGRAVDQAAERVGEAAGDVARGAGRMMQDAGEAIERAARDPRGTQEPPKR